MFKLVHFQTEPDMCQVYLQKPNLCGTDEDGKQRFDHCCKLINFQIMNTFPWILSKFTGSIDSICRKN